MHTAEGHIRESGGYLTTLTHNEGGEVWVEDDDGITYEDLPRGLRRGSTYTIARFQSRNHTHHTCSWDRFNRVTLVVYCISRPQALTTSQVQYLEELGFKLPPTSIEGDCLCPP